MKMIAFTVADQNNLQYLPLFERSLRKFHPAEELPLRVFGPKEILETNDPAIFYRATPYFAKKLMDEGYEKVLKFDIDQIITGSLAELLADLPYDVGTVYNWNRKDAQHYQPVGVWDISPQEYVNCGLVVMTSQPFVEQWLRLCNSPRFHRYQYKEQDLLNILCAYGDYRVRCFDKYDPERKYRALHGLAAKGHWLQMEVRGKELVIPKQADGSITEPTVVKVMHWAGGGQEKKMHYRTSCTEEVISYLDALVQE